MLAVPAATPVTSPVASTVATAVLLLLQTPAAVALVKVMLSPANTELGPAVAATVGMAFTVRVCCSVPTQPLPLVTV
ncbi:hypothetical protein D3C86_767880 [compost metagenome]